MNHTDFLGDHVCYVSISSERLPSFLPSKGSKLQTLSHSWSPQKVHKEEALKDFQATLL